MTIITGTGRSGTGMLARVFGGWHEFRVPYIESKYLSGRPSGKGNPFSSPEARLSAVLDLHQGICTGTFIDASNLYVYLIDALWSLYPGVRFILGVRNVWDFVLSALARGWHERRPEDLMFFPGDPGYESWSAPDPVRRMGVLWVHRNACALHALEALPRDCWTLVRIEELDRAELDRLALHAGTPLRDPEAVSRGVNKGPNLGKDRAISLTKREENTLWQIAGPVMTRLGYSAGRS